MTHHKIGHQRRAHGRCQCRQQNADNVENGAEIEQGSGPVLFAQVS